MCVEHLCGCSMYAETAVKARLACVCVIREYYTEGVYLTGQMAFHERAELMSENCNSPYK